MTRGEAAKTAKKLKLSDLMVEALEDIVVDLGEKDMRVRKQAALVRRGLIKVDLQSGRITALTDAGRNLAIGLGIDVKYWEECRARHKKAEAAARKKVAAPVKTRYSGAMRNLLLRLLHHGNANLSQNDRTAEALIERDASASRDPRTPAPVRWVSWGWPREGEPIRQGEPKFLHGRGRLMLTAAGRDDAKAMEADGVKRDAITEEGVEQLLLEAIEFADSENLFKRMGHKVSTMSFRHAGRRAGERSGLVVTVDDAVFRVSIEPI
ncbi:hypothetical protein LCGC14_0334910 [marine sediment metagenome]|uniref:Uncharacterized protein n=1 Tax=marine sediment metagenome TaxID=412755 RepID=A0A0F9WMX2_9ZZZZ